MDGNNQPVALHGANYSGTEYACIQGWGIFDGPSDNAMVAAIQSWNVNIVNIGLNEDCILGINGVPAQYAGANYMNAVKSFVTKLHAHGMYAKITLFWTAAGSRQALDLDPILNTDHSAAALQQMASFFGSDGMTILAPMEEPNGIGWACWKNGGSSCSVGFSALGMQSAVNTLRQAGATNVVALPGIDYANNLTQWVSNKPTDAMNQLMASSDVYGGNSCYSPACLTAQDSQVIAAVPLVFSEFGETYDGSSCGTTNVQNIVGWAESHGVGYLAWAWDTWGTCLSLIDDFDGTPHGAWGTWVRTHYLGLP